jgi:hypothetical protein
LLELDRCGVNSFHGGLNLLDSSLEELLSRIDPVNVTISETLCDNMNETLAS